MTREYQKPELVDLKNSRAAGACIGGSSAQDCTSGNVPKGTQCLTGWTAESNCLSGSIVGGTACNTGPTFNTCTTGQIPG